MKNNFEKVTGNLFYVNKTATTRSFKHYLYGEIVAINIHYDKHILNR